MKIRWFTVRNNPSTCLNAFTNDDRRQTSLIAGDRRQLLTTVGARRRLPTIVDNRRHRRRSWKMVDDRERSLTIANDRRWSTIVNDRLRSPMIADSRRQLSRIVGTRPRSSMIDHRFVWLCLPARPVAVFCFESAHFRNIGHGGGVHFVSGFSSVLHKRDQHPKTSKLVRMDPNTSNHVRTRPNRSKNVPKDAKTLRGSKMFGQIRSHFGSSLRPTQNSS